MLRPFYKLCNFAFNKCFLESQQLYIIYAVNVLLKSNFRYQIVAPLISLFLHKHLRIQFINFYENKDEIRLWKQSSRNKTVGQPMLAIMVFSRVVLLKHKYPPRSIFSILFFLILAPVGGPNPAGQILPWPNLT